jgi:hypothetical protein
VDYLVSKALAKSRSDAVRIARLVNSQLNLFEHVSNEHDFEDGYYFYQFKQHTTFVESEEEGGFESASQRQSTTELKVLQPGPFHL